MWTYIHSDELYHHGVKGMKWGVRRYQNKDGSLTSAGKKRLAKSIQKTSTYKTVEKTKNLIKSDSNIKKFIPNIKNLRDQYQKAANACDKAYAKHQSMDHPVVKKLAFEQEKAYRNYMTECKKVTDNLVGSYGNRRLRNIDYNKEYYPRVDNVVMRAIDDIVREQ